MAYVFGTTRDNMVYLVLRMLKVLERGGTPSETMEDEVEKVLNVAIKSLDGAGWMQQRTDTPATIAISANDWYATLPQAVVTIQSAYFVATSDTIGHDIRICSAKECFANGPLYIPGLPTHACITIPSAPQTAGQIWFNRRFSHAGTFTYVYKAQSNVLTADADTFVSTGYGEEFIQIVLLMAAIDLAPAFGASLGAMQEMRTQLQGLLGMAKVGQQLMHPGTVLPLMAQTPIVGTELTEENR